MAVKENVRTIKAGKKAAQRSGFLLARVGARSQPNQSSRESYFGKNRGGKGGKKGRKISYGFTEANGEKKTARSLFSQKVHSRF